MLTSLLVLSLICASIAYTVSEQEIFRPVREWTKKKTAWIHKLISCGYCLGHWVAFGLVFVYRPRVVHSTFPLADYFFTALLIAWLSGFQWRAMVFCGKIIKHIHMMNARNNP